MHTARIYTLPLSGSSSISVKLGLATERWKLVNDKPTTGVRLKFSRIQNLKRRNTLIICILSTSSCKIRR